MIHPSYKPSGGGGGGVVEDGSITSAKFAADAKAPLAGVADSATAVAWAGVSGKPANYTPAAHTHTVANVTDLQAALDGKAASTHVHTIANVTGLQEGLNGKAATAHTHTIANVTDLQAGLDGKQAKITGITALAPEADLPAVVAKINEIIAKFV